MQILWLFRKIEHGYYTKGIPWAGNALFQTPYFPHVYDAIALSRCLTLIVF